MNNLYITKIITWYWCWTSVGIGVCIDVGDGVGDDVGPGVGSTVGADTGSVSNVVGSVGCLVSVPLVLQLDQQIYYYYYYYYVVSFG